MPDQGWPNLDDDQLVILSKRQKRPKIPLRPVFRLQRASVLPTTSALHVKTRVNKAPTLQNEKVGSGAMLAKAGSIGDAWGSRVTLRPWINGRGLSSLTTLYLTFFRYCQPCLRKDVTRSISHKPPIRKSSRKRTTREIFDQQTGPEPNTNKWLKMLEGKPILKESFKRMNGEDVCLTWIEQDPHAMEEPTVIETPEGLGMKMPPVELSVAGVSEILGEKTPIEVIGLTFPSYRIVPVSKRASLQMYLPNRIPPVGLLENGRIISRPRLLLVTRFAM